MFKTDFIFCMKEQNVFNRRFIYDSFPPPTQRERERERERERMREREISLNMMT